MKTAAIIAEYNPFHKGHEYHINETRRKSSADLILVLLSSDFTQRGEIALCDKYLRTRMALEGGADLVLELPLAISTASAEFYAKGAVSILNRLSVIDYLSFGAENNDLQRLQQLAEFLLKEPSDYKLSLQKGLQRGLSFPSAREEALKESFPDLDIKALTSTPNNILALEYLKSLMALKSPIKPLCINRTLDNYNNKELVTDGFSSASAIRQSLKSNPPSSLSAFLPECSLKLLEGNYRKCLPLYPEDISGLLYYRLLYCSPKELALYADLSESLAGKIKKRLPEYTSAPDFAQSLKSRDLTLTRINRALIHILLNLKADAYEDVNFSSASSYVNLLGFKKSALPLLNKIKSQGNIKLLSKAASGSDILTPGEMSCFDQTTRASMLYQSIIQVKFSVNPKNPFRQSPIIID